MKRNKTFINIKPNIPDI